MAQPRVTQQTSTTLPLAGGLARGSAPQPKVLLDGRFAGGLQWALEGPGWTAMRPAVDFVLLCFAVVATLGGWHATLHPTTIQAPLLALPPLAMILLYTRGQYRKRLRALVLDSIVPVVSAVSVAAMAVATIGLLVNGQAPSQSEAVRAWLLALLGVSLGRISLAGAQRSARARRLVGEPVLIVGAGIVGSQVARRLERHPDYGLVPVGFVDDDPRSVAEVGGRDVPVLGTVEDLDEIVAQSGVRKLIVAFSSAADARISRLIQHCQELGVDVSVVPRMFDTMNQRAWYDTVGGTPLLTFSTVDPRGWQFALKHAFDGVFAVMLLIVLSPLLAIFAVAVRLSSPGPVLFRQRRVGRDGRVFDLYKFRSMRMDPAQAGGQSEEEGEEENVALDLLLGGDTAPGGVEGEDRRTRVGRIMRRSSIDELPQLLNVLKGEMSVVGPRPERPEFVKLFKHDVARYGDRHRVKSGITGWAQVHGLRGQTSLAERVEWDNYYIAHWSLGLDLKILVLTVAAVVRSGE
jgi:exopolysaccharide biosynthesis polyprenyl glycosylphosphotransferase